MDKKTCRWEKVGKGPYKTECGGEVYVDRLIYRICPMCSLEIEDPSKEEKK